MQIIWLLIDCLSNMGTLLEAKCLRVKALDFTLLNPTWANVFPLWTSFFVSVKWGLKCLPHKIIVRIKWVLEKALRYFCRAHLVFNKEHTTILLLMKVVQNQPVPPVFLLNIYPKPFLSCHSLSHLHVFIICSFKAWLVKSLILDSFSTLSLLSSIF